MKRFFKYLMVLIVFLPVVLLCACKESTYKLNFMINGSVYHTIESSGNETITLPEEPTKDGYLFDGWYFDADYLNELTADSYKEKEISHDTNVYAKWLVVDYTITYHLDGGANGNNPISYKVTDNAITLEPAEKFGYTFAGWYTEPTFENKIETIPANSTGNVELCAKFELYNPELQFSIIPEGVEVSGYTGESETIIIPSIYNNVKVVSIGERAFRSNSTILSVNIPDSITQIKSKAFEFCSSLSYINFPEGLTVIESYAFSNCNFREVTIPKNVSTIGSQAFMGCRRLERINFNAEHLSDLTSSPFSMSGGQSFKIEVYIGAKVQRIPANLFNTESRTNSLHQKLSAVVFEENSICRYIGNHAFRFSNIRNISLPNSVVEIGNGAFSGCEKLVSITIPENITEISDGCFSGCKELEYVTLSNSIIKINEAAFYNCSSLKNIALPTSLNIIKEYAFYQCSSLEDFTIPSSLNVIEKYAFYGCSGFTRLIVPTTVTTIGNGAFGKGMETTMGLIFYEHTTPNPNWSSYSYSYFYSEQEPEDDSYFYYWHYVDGEIVIWE